MFSGIGNQISGFVSSKIPGAAPAGGEPAPEGVDPNDPNAAVGENGEVPQEGGAMGFAKGLLGKAMAVKEGAMAKAGEMGAGNIGVSNDEQGNIPHDNKHIDKTIETVNFLKSLPFSQSHSPLS